ncbi:MAG: hypothetical protein ONB44_06795 [candidate division KSB1 bacterium]|nr:hypothetical protein [candidate division KSB1 bacterium]MDZ7301831.1 hypothetical protein [candidate division KSB1 bacterium]MDZ7310214.1 hypothetical protein [candidate division KSB1 bacterium]
MVKIQVENLADSIRARAGEISENQVHRLEIEALVDTGTTLLCLPKSNIDLLGLMFLIRAGQRRPMDLSIGEFIMARILQYLAGLAVLTSWNFLKTRHRWLAISRWKVLISWLIPRAKPSSRIRRMKASS